MRGPSGQAGCSVVALVAGLVLVATAGHGAVVGVRRDPFTGAPRQGDPVWLRLHQGLAARAATLGHTEVAFYGDSITEGWLGLFKGKKNPLGKGASTVLAWLERRLQTPIEVMGIAGDTVSNLLWRMENGEFPPQLSVKVAVICIGVNDLLQGQDPHEVSFNIRSLLSDVYRAHRNTSFLLVGLLPESSGNASVIPDQRTVEVNSWLLKKYQGSKTVTYVDCRRILTAADGHLYPDNYVKDAFKYLHLSERGYKALGYCLYPRLKQLLGPHVIVAPSPTQAQAVNPGFIATVPAAAPM